MTRYRPLITWAALMIFTWGFGAFQAQAQTQIFLDVEDDIAWPGNLVPVSIFLQNLDDSIQAFQMGITLDRPDIMSFRSDTVAQTCFECADSACTSVVAFPCTVAIVPVTAEGTLVQNWEFIQANTFGSFDIRLTGIADTDFDGFPGPIVPFTNGILIKVIAEVYCDLPDSLTDRTVVATISPVNTFFSNTLGDLIDSVQFSQGSVTIIVPDHGDLDGDGAIDSIDLARMIDQVFFGGVGACPAHVSDITCDGSVDSLDLAWIIDFVFFGGAPSPC